MGQPMDNVIPFLAPQKVDRMIDVALATSQVKTAETKKYTSWKIGGVAMAASLVASLALFLSFIPSLSPSMNEPVLSTAAQKIAAEDVNDFQEMVMLETLERY